MSSSLGFGAGLAAGFAAGFAADLASALGVAGVSLTGLWLLGEL
ncbi:hypothetical protein [Synechococcus sp. UW179B]|nr:hypothetical protein [Synechococcus sp. UW179B]